MRGNDIFWRDSEYEKIFFLWRLSKKTRCMCCHDIVGSNEFLIHLFARFEFLGHFYWWTFFLGFVTSNILQNIKRMPINGKFNFRTFSLQTKPKAVSQWTCSWMTKYGWTTIQKLESLKNLVLSCLIHLVLICRCARVNAAAYCAWERGFLSLVTTSWWHASLSDGFRLTMSETLRAHCPHKVCTSCVCMPHYVRRVRV